LAEKSWSILAENWWYILAENPWYIYVRKLTNPKQLVTEAFQAFEVNP
jgi:hypothetical protein